jgi:hypothetical protein
LHDLQRLGSLTKIWYYLSDTWDKSESLITRVNSYCNILNAYNAAREAESLLNSLNRSEGSQRALYKGESLIARVNGYRSILNAYDAGREVI